MADDANKEMESEIGKVIFKVMQDMEFRKALIKDPDKTLEPFHLSDVQKMLIKTLDEEDFNKLTVDNIHEYFSADAAVYTPDMDEELEEDDFNDDDDDDY